ncbi:hypothetical protein KAFR_0J00120 [Kazachstania africana CBS 2517]|uniref:PCI domain-containing protein n=1 Tax=Kazachstania africana (strain ATCC 22294 / BCRC 22015 / CBS 2517 / CECT 1963 / NBRC 1671 / NRRL Y-8276) TaxID=1071382 RepID=H2B0D0_KAZAF|nr:hypothetical protein KAFR_0J00120 [Kazachstania africana CBS 2517]CCF60080.1 hypothetical protein KAFR_0J00120 [Kazachstania africana CBS 2517]
MSDLPQLAKSLSIAFDSKDYKTCEKLLSPIKIELIKANLLIPDSNRLANETYLNDLEITKKSWKLVPISSIFNMKFDVFQNYFAQLRSFYFNSNSILSRSSNKSKLVSLYLLILLSKGDVTKFHSELEYLDHQIINLQDDELLSLPIRVDKFLMEGSYQKAWNLLQSGLNEVPEFKVFTVTLMNTIRDEISNNIELSYNDLPLSNIKALLFFNNEKETESFALQRDWSIKNSIVTFDQENILEDNVESNGNETENNLIEKILGYAIDLETIV